MDSVQAVQIGRQDYIDFSDALTEYQNYSNNSGQLFIDKEAQLGQASIKVKYATSTATSLLATQDYGKNAERNAKSSQIDMTSAQGATSSSDASESEQNNNFIEELTMKKESSQDLSLKDSQMNNDAIEPVFGDVCYKHDASLYCDESSSKGVESSEAKQVQDSKVSACTSDNFSIIHILQSGSSAPNDVKTLNDVEDCFMQELSTDTEYSDNFNELDFCEKNADNCILIDKDDLIQPNDIHVTQTAQATLAVDDIQTLDFCLTNSKKACTSFVGLKIDDGSFISNICDVNLGICDSLSEQFLQYNSPDYTSYNRLLEMLCHYHDEPIQLLSGTSGHLISPNTAAQSRHSIAYKSRPDTNLVSIVAIETHDNTSYIQLVKVLQNISKKMSVIDETQYNFTKEDSHACKTESRETLAVYSDNETANTLYTTQSCGSKVYYYTQRNMSEVVQAKEEQISRSWFTSNHRKNHLMVGQVNLHSVLAWQLFKRESIQKIETSKNIFLDENASINTSSFYTSSRAQMKESVVAFAEESLMTRYPVSSSHFNVVIALPMLFCTLFFTLFHSQKVSNSDETKQNKRRVYRGHSASIRNSILLSCIVICSALMREASAGGVRWKTLPYTQTKEATVIVEDDEGKEDTQLVTDDVDPTSSVKILEEQNDCYLFCGSRGCGDNCLDRYKEIPNCQRPQNETFPYGIYGNFSRTGEEGDKQDYPVATCTQCNPGYYSEIIKFSTIGQIIYACKKQKSSITKNFFIRPNMKDFFIDEELEKDMYRQLHDDQAGQRVDDSFYFLQQAFSMPGDQEKLLTDLYKRNQAADSTEYDLVLGNLNNKMFKDLVDITSTSSSNEFDVYQNVTFNIWLFQGIHHFVQCQDYLPEKYDNFDTSYHVLCKNKETYYPLRKNDQKYDNIKFYVRPLECKLKKTIFRESSNYIDYINYEQFDENCVDFERGDAKPQVRVHGQAAFNITNFAQFENIEFTGEDNLVEFIDDIIMKEIVDYAPQGYCQYKNEPTGYLETPEFNTKDGSGFKCFSGFNVAKNQVPMKADTACNEEITKESLGVRFCPGEPNHAEFFKQTTHSYPSELHLQQNDKQEYLFPQDAVYSKRHRVLFNLYAFDASQSDLTHPPTLNLYNCDFKYFHDKQALIQVENNNFFQNATESITLIGGDRGARIDIKSSSFKHSKFCKGMISYRQAQDISLEQKFTFQFYRYESQQFSDGREKSFIRIRESIFTNLAYQQTVNVLSNLDKMTTSCGPKDFACVFSQYDHRGFVINASGFSGSIQIQDSKFNLNMAYIKEYLVQENLSSSKYMNITAIQKSEFEQRTDPVSFKVCDGSNAQYLFQQLADSRTNFDNIDFVKKYESISTIVILANKGPIIIKDNIFEENIGTMGGAIHIMSPDFESNVDQEDEVNSLPFIYLESNNFYKNMAYFAGNAIYMAHTIKRVDDLKDYRNMCGAGVNIVKNHFEGNIGLKRHNGGAYLHHCIRYDSIDEGFAVKNQTSSLQLASRNKTEDDRGDYEYFYDDPKLVTANITDLYDSSLNYTVFKYATRVANNNFTKNFAGMKGSAFALIELNEIQVSNNWFEQNGPVTSYAEIEYSPYYKYFAQGTRSLSYNVPIYCSNSTNEFDYIENCVNQKYFIDMPALKGAVYIEHCQDKYLCSVHVSQAYLDSFFASGESNQVLLGKMTDFEQKHQIGKPYHRAEISFNVFKNNQVLPPMQNEQTVQQASCIYLSSGNNILLNNTFKDHRNEFVEQIKMHAPRIYNYMHQDYFEFSQAPLVYISYNSEMPEEIVPDLATEIEANWFYNNKHIQIEVIALKIHGSLIEFSSSSSHIKFQMNKNLIEQNLFIGDQSSLISINGGIMNITENNMTGNGYISSEIISGYPSTVLLGPHQKFPYSQYTYTNAQMHGIFAFYFQREDLPAGKTHLIRLNTFSHNFCMQGCAYNAQGNSMQQIYFESNTYSYMVASINGAVFSGSDYKLEMNKSKFFLQFFKNETISNTVGGAIDLKNMNNAGLTIIENCIFYNNFGPEGGSINMEEGGSLFAIENHFSLDPMYLMVPKELQDLIQRKQSFGNERLLTTTLNSDLLPPTADMKPSIAAKIRESYTGNIAFEELINEDSLSIVDSQINTYGQLRQYSSVSDLSRYLDLTVVAEGITLEEFVSQRLNDDEDYDWSQFYTASIILDNEFESLIGQVASAITIDNTYTAILSKSNKFLHFQNNVSTAGTTIHSFQAKIYMNEIKMTGNMAVKGGCIYISESQFDASNSVFSQNKALQGGVISAMNGSKFQIEASSIMGNMAKDGSILFAMSNTSDDKNGQPVASLKFLDSEIKENWATQNQMQILFSSIQITNCKLFDNYAHQVSHGITLFSSTLIVEQTQISLSKEMKKMLEILDLNSIEAGFFNLYMFSELYISKQTVVRDLMASKQSVLSANTDCSVYMSEDVQFIDNNSNSPDGYTMLLKGTKMAQISDVKFSGNQQINIMISDSSLKITNCTFTNGQRQHIYAKNSHIAIDSVSIFDSKDLSAEGHGVTCESCLSLSVTNSTFHNLTSFSSPAIFVFNQTGVESLIEFSIFESNHALGSVGAIKLQDAGSVLIKQNKFINNLVSDDIAPIPEWHHCDAGAIYFQCNPHASISDKECLVTLENNLFKDNSVKNKGGALRYVNKNFTTVFTQESDGRRILSNRALSVNELYFVDTNTYIGNQAAYAPNIASYPATYKYVHNQIKFQSDSIQELTFVSGQVLDMQVEIYDQEGRIFRDEDYVACSIEFVNKDQLGSGNQIDRPDAAVSSKGLITFDQTQIMQKPDTIEQIRFIFTGLELFGNEIDSFSNPVPIKMYSRSCIEGEIYSEDLSCQSCPTGFRLYELQEEPGVCDICLENEICYGLNSTAPIQEYWRSSPTSTNYMKCFNLEACLVGNEDEPLGICKDGYGGILCADCIDRFYRSGPFECKECDESPLLNIFFFCCYLIAFLVAVVLLVRCTMNGSKQRKPLIPVYMKILLNHLQILQVIAGIKFGWPQQIQTILEFNRYLMTLPTQIISFDCFMIDYITGENPEARFSYILLVSFVTIPFVVIIITYLLWKVIGCIYKLTKQDEVDKQISTISIIWFIFYPTIVGSLAQSINCIEIEGILRLYNDLEEVCFQGTHLTILQSISVPGLILWAFGVPMLGFCLMKRFRKNVEDTDSILKRKTHENLEQRYKLRFAFLLQGYENQYYYWEVVMLLRKTILVLLATFLAPISAGTQSCAIIGLLIASLCFQCKFKPYYDSKLNDLETLSILMHIGIIYMGLYYQAGKNDPFVKDEGFMWFVFVVVLIVSILFSAFFAKLLHLEILKATARNNTRWFKLLSCGRIKNREDFMQEHIEHGEMGLSKLPSKSKQAAYQLADIAYTDASIVSPIDISINSEQNLRSLVLPTQSEFLVQKNDISEMWDNDIMQTDGIDLQLPPPIDLTKRQSSMSATKKGQDRNKMRRTDKQTRNTGELAQITEEVSNQDLSEVNSKLFTQIEEELLDKILNEDDGKQLAQIEEEFLDQTVNEFDGKQFAQIEEDFPDQELI